MGIPRKIIVSGIFVTLLAFTNNSLPETALAQSDLGCDFDLSSVSTLLMKAQAKASAGDLADGLKLLTQAQEQLAQIQTQCGTGGSPTPGPTIPALSQTFSATDGSFSVKYPEGWITASLNGSSADKKAPKPILLASNQATVEAMNNNTPAAVLNGIAVYVDIPQQVIIALGAFEPDVHYDELDAKGLLEAVIGATPPNSGGLFGKPDLISIDTRQAGEASFSFSPLDKTSTKVKYDGVFLILPLSVNQFTALVGVTTPGQTKAIQALVQAVAATVQLG